MRLRFAAVVLASLTCKSPGETVNRFHGVSLAEDTMGSPSAVARRPQEEEDARSRKALEGVRITALKPTFKFGNGDILYENENGSAQIRRGREIIHEGKVIERLGDGSFTFRTNDDYEFIFHKDGVGTLIFYPEEVRNRHKKSR